MHEVYFYLKGEIDQISETLYSAEALNFRIDAIILFSNCLII